MASPDGRYELTTSLSITGGSRESLEQYAARFEEALVKTLRGNPTITAYYATPNYAAYEIEVGLRFEGMEPRYIEDAASHILDDCIAQVSSPIHSALTPIREESTLVPA